MKQTVLGYSEPRKFMNIYTVPFIDLSPAFVPVVLLGVHSCQMIGRKLRQRRRLYRSIIDLI